MGITGQGEKLPGHPLPDSGYLSGFRYSPGSRPGGKEFKKPAPYQPFFRGGASAA